MKKELKDKWIAALLSGEYKQVTGFLETPEGNCCLGVLCRVANIPMQKVTNQCLNKFVLPNGEEAVRNFNSGFCDFFKLPICVKDDLWRMNDGVEDCQNQPLSFAEIADYIEKNVEVENE